MSLEYAVNPGCRPFHWRGPHESTRTRAARYTAGFGGARYHSRVRPGFGSRVRRVATACVKRVQTQNMMANCQPSTRRGYRRERALSQGADVTSAEEVKGCGKGRKTIGPQLPPSCMGGANQLKVFSPRSEKQTTSDGCTESRRCEKPAERRRSGTAAPSFFFGSVIARSGMRGEGDYAVANEWLSHSTERFQAEHPNCRCLTSSGQCGRVPVAGRKVGCVDALMREGIMPPLGVSQL